MNRKPGAHLFRDRKPINHAALSRCAEIIWKHRDRYFVLARENFAEPADASCHCQYSTEDGD